MVYIRNDPEYAYIRVYEKNQKEKLLKRSFNFFKKDLLLEAK